MKSSPLMVKRLGVLMAVGAIKIFTPGQCLGLRQWAGALLILDFLKRRRLILFF